MSTPVYSDGFLERQALIAAATAGDPEAQSMLGDVFRVGDDWTEQDLSDSIKWYRFAAMQDDREAQNNLGSMYYHGMGVPQDFPEAVHWYRKAALQRLAIAEFNLAECYLDGKGVEPNDREAVAWLRKAGKLGHVGALSELGTLYLLGRGVEQNYVAAGELHVLAALQGDADAIEKLGAYRPELEQEALGGSLVAALCLARMYDNGIAVERNKAQTLAWLYWGEKHGTRDADSDVIEHVGRMRKFYELLDDEVKKEASQLLGNMQAVPLEMLKPRPERRGRGNSQHRKAEKGEQ